MAKRGSLSLAEGPRTPLCALPAVGMGMPLLPRGRGRCDLVTTDRVFHREGPQPSGMSMEGGGPPRNHQVLTHVCDPLVQRESFPWL